MMVRIAIITAWTWVHGGYKHERAGIVDGIFRTAYGDATVFKRLAHNLENASVELWQLVTKEYAVVGKRDFAWLRVRTSAYESHL